MVVRDKNPEDIAVVRDVSHAAFVQSAEADLVDALRHSTDSVISLIAENEDGGIIGHILFSRLQAPEQCLALAPVSLHPDHQNKGVGTRLIEEGLARARSEGWHVAG